MKKMKKSLVLLMSFLFIPIMLIGCSSKPKVSPDETAKILFNFYIKGDQSGLEKIKMPKDVIDETAKLQKETYTTAIKNNFKVAGLTIKDEQVEQIYEARMEGLKKLTVTTETVSESDTEAQVKIKSTYFDTVALDKKAAQDAVEQVKKLKLTNQQEAKTKVTDAYIKNLVEAFKNVKPSADTKEKTFKFTIQEKVWLPQNMIQFGSGIGGQVSGM
ncbi:DUF5105 domain-containing protein [Clostridium ganghwense]|uniref:DUF5105 domain-containing protein n=1 Tax=Clostridium ganghwense TaxID=312089 RepID=A0ABT4CMQ1_9CLOT|nr:DUF5105 domain-containing protein [Clostridium ganghwense]MCY6369703.1 DUF5105 domain-containing protein [Clostridium ganghwense]